MALIVWVGGASAQAVDTVFVNSTHPQLCATLDQSAQWQEHPIYTIEENTYSCLRANIALSHSQKGAWLHMSALASSRIYWDGILLSENGRPAQLAENEIPGLVEFRTYLTSEQLRVGSHELRIELSTHHVGADLHTIFYYLGLEPIENATVNEHLVAVATMAALLVFGVLFLLLYFLYQPNIQYLVFSVLSFSSSLLLLVENWRELFNYTYNYHTDRLWWVLGLTLCVNSSLTTFCWLNSRFTSNIKPLIVVHVLFAIVALLPLSFDAISVFIFLVGLQFCILVSITSLRINAPVGYAYLGVPLLALGLLLMDMYQFLDVMFSNVALLIALVMTALLIRDMKSERRRAINALQLELELLKRSLQPHFLMNSLTLLMEWVETQPKLAVDFIEELAQEFRLLMKFSQQSLILLDDELSLCKHHLRIMSLRYERDFRLSVKGDTNSIDIPPAILHIQIENSFSHGELLGHTDFTLEVTQADNGQIRLNLLCPMAQQSQEPAVGFGVGERYIKARLAAEFGNKYDFISEKSSNNSWRTEFKIPCTS
ncbi:histidine kinase [Gilvimarinus sp. SDUM040013]|uniref:Histidine kinase n=1 Tax=Gilvimarinus gilvus TaxID=3058038 RepID=A0ABU4S1B4_9GAMM|nr:sensor histidine kinase [Gilvimarinus sp. SDUM040013]MDO3388067.1 histidine kinase [Gilvimarinus sp. SDUM040013]MDX6850975.1 histidine kinase [Gilvimarinus sp. SDUM040013]